MGVRHGDSASVSTATIPEVQAMPEQATDASEQTLHPRRPKGEPLFNAQQQLAFDKAFTRRERKVRAEYQGVLTDLFETVGIAKELLARCKDRLSVED